MKITTLKYLLIALGLFIFTRTYAQTEFTLQPGTVIKLADKQRQEELIRTEDEYTAVLSKFDLESKTNIKDNPSLKDYLDNAASQTLDWSESDITNIKNAVEKISSEIASHNLKLNFPPVIELVKTTMMEEGGADAYTRLNYIVLGKEVLGENPEEFKYLLTHELFHILSRNDRDSRERVYNTIGFKKTNDIPYPDELKDLRISNPDAPHYNYYITVTKDGKPVNVILLLYASKPYQGGSFFSYVKLGLMALEGEPMSMKPVMENGKAVIYGINDVENFYEQVGKNTGYIIHEEEVCADHFIMLLSDKKGMPNPDKIEKMSEALNR